MSNISEILLKSEHCKILKIAGEVGDALNVNTYLVGGYVRDIILGNKLKDIDIMVEDRVFEYSKKLSKKLNVNKTVEFEKFLTVKIPYSVCEIEVANARQETYDKDSRKPKTVELTTVENDLIRRDFKINSIASSLNNKNFGLLVDPFNGLVDINKGLIDTPTDPDTTFIDDPLRMLRAIRFSAQLEFKMHPRIMKSIKDNKERIKIISQELLEQFKDKKNIIKDIELLSSQVERCNQILKKLSLNPIEEDVFIDENITIRDFLVEIITSFRETSKKEFILNTDQDSNKKKITKSMEIIYGLRNFIGNANKYSSNKVYITLKSDNDFTEIIIEDDGNGYPKDVLSKIGEPYLRSNDPIDKSKTGLGLGLFIGKTLLEKNFASINCRNSKTRTGAEVIIKWNNKDLFNI